MQKNVLSRNKGMEGGGGGGGENTVVICNFENILSFRPSEWQK